MARRRSLMMLAVLARRVAKLLDDVDETDDSVRTRANGATEEDIGAPRRLLEPGTLPGEGDAGPPAVWAERVRRSAPWLLDELSGGRARSGAAAPADSAMRLRWPAPSIGEPRWPARLQPDVRMESGARHAWDDRGQIARPDGEPRSPLPNVWPSDDESNGVDAGDADGAVRARAASASRVEAEDRARTAERKESPFDWWRVRSAPARETRFDAPQSAGAQSRTLEYARERPVARERDVNAPWSRGGEQTEANNASTQLWPAPPEPDSAKADYPSARDAMPRDSLAHTDGRAAYTQSAHVDPRLEPVAHRAEHRDAQRPEETPRWPAPAARAVAREGAFTAEQMSSSRNAPARRTPAPEPAHPWPELPTSPSQPDDGALSAALREAEHWRRITREQAGDPWSA
jgi:hypothetical protein